MVGVGGLGVPASLVLAQSGIGTIGLVDPDSVELSNLNRQLFYRAGDCGRPKVDCAAALLSRYFPHLRLEAKRMRVEPGNVLALLRQFDFIIDATDGSETKYLLNDAAIVARRPLSHAGVVGLNGQTMTILDRYRLMGHRFFIGRKNSIARF